MNLLSRNFFVTPWIGPTSAHREFAKFLKERMLKCSGMRYFATLQKQTSKQSRNLGHIACRRLSVRCERPC